MNTVQSITITGPILVTEGISLIHLNNESKVLYKDSMLNAAY